MLAEGVMDRLEKPMGCPSGLLKLQWRIYIDLCQREPALPLQQQQQQRGDDPNKLSAHFQRSKRALGNKYYKYLGSVNA